MIWRSLPGLTRYELARELQLKLVELRARDQIEDTILVLEHEPVITRGRGLQFQGPGSGEEGVGQRQMPLASIPVGVDYFDSERGGDLTYHGPGQLVLYPIVKLNGSSSLAPHHDIGGFLRAWEQLVILWLSQNYQLKACARPNATGIWIEPQRLEEEGGFKKIASIGIAVKKWVTYHGIAINVVNSLAPFGEFSPCGFAPEVMTRLLDFYEFNQSSWRSDAERGLRSLVMQAPSPLSHRDLDPILVNPLPQLLD